MCIKKKKAKAATLMELLVSLGIGVLIIATMFVFFTTTQLSLWHTEALIHGEEQARLVLSRITGELRLSNAYHISIYNISGGGNNLTGNAISFQIPVGSYGENIYLSESLAIAWGSNSTVDNSIIYTLTGNNTLLRQENNGASVVSSVVLAGNIRSLLFKRPSLSSNQITAQIEVQGDPTLNVTRTIKSSVSLRN